MRKHLKGLKNAEYILKIIISNHGGFHSVVFEMNVFIKGNKMHFPNVQTSLHFRTDYEGSCVGVFVLMCENLCLFLLVCFGRPWESGVLIRSTAWVTLCKYE